MPTPDLSGISPSPGVLNFLDIECLPSFSLPPRPVQAATQHLEDQGLHTFSLPPSTQIVLPSSGKACADGWLVFPSLDGMASFSGLRFLFDGRNRRKAHSRGPICWQVSPHSRPFVVWAKVLDQLLARVCEGPWPEAIRLSMGQPLGNWESLGVTCV